VCVCLLAVFDGVHTFGANKHWVCTECVHTQCLCFRAPHAPSFTASPSPQTNFDMGDYLDDAIPPLSGKSREEVKTTLKSERIKVKDGAEKRGWSWEARTWERAAELG
jgi:hypothetical protein